MNLAQGVTLQQHRTLLHQGISACHDSFIHHISPAVGPSPRSPVQRQKHRWRRRDTIQIQHCLAAGKQACTHDEAKKEPFSPHSAATTSVQQSTIYTVRLAGNERLNRPQASRSTAAYFQRFRRSLPMPCDHQHRSFDGQPTEKVHQSSMMSAGHDQTGVCWRLHDPFGARSMGLHPNAGHLASCMKGCGTAGLHSPSETNHPAHCRRSTVMGWRWMSPAFTGESSGTLPLAKRR